ncbi:HxlR family transcriptional regulator [Melghirimyces profundicolus]|uniref:HxlR family transcriptional regulator n=1 Tax=Melghirimyces profundicolus TaxID=1242148 RepID=A0A2T6C0E4_9BACL|nr:helix-turn-helix domain-containing protein [Melghirimyces profundicolus]PTX61789.1 HxlR family transcriptional regulator [Melghirimyces profundicolus]
MKQYNCEIEAALEVIGGKWKAILLYHLTKGPKRTSELKRLVPGITQKMLTQQLRELEKDSVILRKVHSQIPPKVEYSLTEYGRTLEPVLNSLCHWGKRHIQYVYADEEVMVVNKEVEKTT